MGFFARAQISLEFFMAFALALVLFSWMANFLDVFYSSNASAHSSAEARLAVREFAALAGRACASNASISFAWPCVFDGSAPVAYALNSTPAASSTLFLHFLGRPFAAQENAPCKVDVSGFSSGGLRFFACNAQAPNESQAACVAPNGAGSAVFSFGSCG